jgi:hypothetical protein
MMQAISTARKGGYVGYVGVPHGVELNGEKLFYAHVHFHGGPATMLLAPADQVGVGQVDDTLYVRGYNAQKSRWCQAAVRQKAGRVIAAGLTKEVTFEPVDGAINDRIDESYKVKYKGSSYLKPMISARARSATVKVLPREIKAST